MVERRLPRFAELAEFIAFKKPDVHPVRRRLNAARTIDDLRKIAMTRTPRAPFDYADGAADDEITAARARETFMDIEFMPDVLRAVARVDTATTIFGVDAALPFGIAPTGFTRLLHSSGEVAGAAAAAAADIPFSLSTLGTASIEEVRKVSGGPVWFQLYVMRNRELTYSLIERAATSRFDALIVTVDSPIGGSRRRDLRNGFSVPPTLTMSTVLNAIPRPRWWFDLLTTPPLEFASLRGNGSMGEILGSAFDPTLSLTDISTIRSLWPGPLIVKGIQTVEAARSVVELGVDGIVLSSHGGRQLDRAPVPLRVLPDVAREVGRDTTVILDSGIRSGADIVAALAWGADFTLVGRAYLYGLMAGGEAGVARAIEILRAEIVQTMSLLGVGSVDELAARHVGLYGRVTSSVRIGR